MVLYDIYSWIEDYFESRSDPRVENWTLMGSPFGPLTIIAIYLLLVMVILPAYMRNRKPFKLKSIIKYYNIFQVVSCIWLIHQIYTAGWQQGEIKFGCVPVDYSENPNPLKMLAAMYWMNMLKLAELIETVFFVLRKKFNQVSGLHLYHHASTYFLSYLGCKFIGGGMTSFHPMMNSFIHVLMYSYYYMSCLGPGWQKKLSPWKPRLTMAQMIQFVILIAHGLTALPSSCVVPKQFLLIYVPNIVLIFKMFKDFYTESYSKKPEDKVANGSTQNGVSTSMKNEKRHTKKAM
ncbi:hypothetical protein JTB14_037864 [Gonioctena quinquepunctata]|nr:hypothetical protein JTB14_037864 [Gonioctena quinquepunctata]